MQRENRFEDLPDTIDYLDYAKWVGCGINIARAKFHEKGFPLISGMGNKLIANKYQVFLFDIKDEAVKKEFIKEFAKNLMNNLEG